MATTKGHDCSKRRLVALFNQALREARYATAQRLFLDCFNLVKEDDLLTLQLATLYDHSALDASARSRRKLRSRAIQLCRMVLRRSPRSSAASWGIARVLLQKRNPRALRWARQAVRNATCGDRALYVNNLGLAHMKLGHKVRAHQLFRNATKIPCSTFRQTQILVNWAILYDLRNVSMKDLTMTPRTQLAL